VGNFRHRGITFSRFRKELNENVACRGVARVPPADPFEAKALGLTIPAILLARAEEVIE
jgi:hypothetical protein